MTTLTGVAPTPASSVEAAAAPVRAAAAPHNRKYRSDEERRDARRATWRANSRRQYDLYRELCRRHGVDGQGKRWTSHLALLRERTYGRALAANAELLRTETDPYRRYWLERFTLEEIHRIARGLYA